MQTHCLCLLVGVKVELIQAKIKAKHHIWKPFIFRGEFGHNSHKNIFKTPVTKQKVDPLHCFTDEGWEACRKQWGLFSPWALPVCPPRQTSEEGSSEHLFANWGQFQRHSQPCERGQRRITPLSQTGVEKRNTLCTEFIFLCSLCTKLKLF